MNKERESESAGEPEPQPGHLDTASLVRQESYTGLRVSYAALPTWNRRPVISHTPIMIRPHRGQEAQPRQSSATRRS